jgi:hypothetical protein
MVKAGTARRSEMWVDPEATVRVHTEERLRQAERHRRAARARASRTRAGGPAAGSGWRVRETVGYGLVRTGLRLLDARRA